MVKLPPHEGTSTNRESSQPKKPLTAGMEFPPDPVKIALTTVAETNPANTVLENEVRIRPTSAHRPGSAHRPASGNRPGSANRPTSAHPLPKHDEVGSLVKSNNFFDPPFLPDPGDDSSLLIGEDVIFSDTEVDRSKSNGKSRRSFRSGGNMLLPEVEEADRMLESFLSRVRCFGVHHFSVALCLEDLGREMNCLALRLLESERIVDARTLLMVAERHMHQIGRQFREYLQKKGSDTASEGKPGSREDDKQVYNSHHSNSAGSSCPKGSFRSTRKTFRQSFAILASLTLNNLASLERKERNTDKALRYLVQSKMWVGHLTAGQAAVTYLNLSAVLSELGRHREAEIAAKKAVKKSEEDILSLATITPEEYADKVAALSVAYNNWAVQQELLDDKSSLQAVELYKKALRLVTDHLNADHPLREKFEASVEAVMAKTRREKQPDPKVIFLSERKSFGKTIDVSRSFDKVEGVFRINNIDKVFSDSESCVDQAGKDTDQNPDDTPELTTGSARAKKGAKKSESFAKHGTSTDVESGSLLLNNQVPSWVNPDGSLNESQTLQSDNSSPRKTKMAEIRSRRTGKLESLTSYPLDRECEEEIIRSSNTTPVDPIPAAGTGSVHEIYLSHQVTSSSSTCVLETKPNRCPSQTFGDNLGFTRLRNDPERNVNFKASTDVRSSVDTDIRASAETVFTVLEDAVIAPNEVRKRNKEEAAKESEWMNSVWQSKEMVSRAVFPPRSQPGKPTFTSPTKKRALKPASKKPGVQSGKKTTNAAAVPRGNADPPSATGPPSASAPAATASEPPDIISVTDIFDASDLMPTPTSVADRSTIAFRKKSTVSPRFAAAEDREEERRKTALRVSHPVVVPRLAFGNRSNRKSFLSEDAKGHLRNSVNTIVSNSSVNNTNTPPPQFLTSKTTIAHFTRPKVNNSPQPQARNSTKPQPNNINSPGERSQSPNLSYISVRSPPQSSTFLSSGAPTCRTDYSGMDHQVLLPSLRLPSLAKEPFGIANTSLPSAAGSVVGVGGAVSQSNSAKDQNGVLFPSGSKPGSVLGDLSALDTDRNTNCGSRRIPSSPLTIKKTLMGSKGSAVSSRQGSKDIDVVSLGEKSGYPTITDAVSTEMPPVSSHDNSYSAEDSVQGWTKEDRQPGMTAENGKNSNTNNSSTCSAASIATVSSSAVSSSAVSSSPTAGIPMRHEQIGGSAPSMPRRNAAFGKAFQTNPHISNTDRYGKHIEGHHQRVSAPDSAIRKSSSKSLLQDMVEQSRALQKIQRWWRKTLERIRMKHYTENESKILLIQSRLRKKHQSKDEDKKRNATLTIQCRWRMRKLRRKREFERNQAALTIQKKLIRARQRKNRLRRVLSTKKKDDAELVFERFADWKFFTFRTRKREKKIAGSEIRSVMARNNSMTRLLKMKAMEEKNEKLYRETQRNEKLRALCQKVTQKSTIQAKKQVFEKLREKGHRIAECQDLIRCWLWYQVRHRLPRQKRCKKAAKIQGLVRGVQLRKRLSSTKPRLDSSEVSRTNGIRGSYVQIGSRMPVESSFLRLFVIVRKRFRQSDWRFDFHEYNKSLSGSLGDPMVSLYLSEKELIEEMPKCSLNSKSQTDECVQSRRTTLGTARSSRMWHEFARKALQHVDVEKVLSRAALVTADKRCDAKVLRGVDSLASAIQKVPESPAKSDTNPTPETTPAKPDPVLTKSPVAVKPPVGVRLTPEAINSRRHSREKSSPSSSRSSNSVAVLPHGNSNIDLGLSAKKEFPAVKHSRSASPGSPDLGGTSTFKKDEQKDVLIPAIPPENVGKPAETLSDRSDDIVIPSATGKDAMVSNARNTVEVAPPEVPSDIGSSIPVEVVSKQSSKYSSVFEEAPESSDPGPSDFSKKENDQRGESPRLDLREMQRLRETQQSKCSNYTDYTQTFCSESGTLAYQDSRNMFETVKTIKLGYDDDGNEQEVNVLDSAKGSDHHRDDDKAEEKEQVKSAGKEQADSARNEQPWDEFLDEVAEYEKDLNRTTKGVAFADTTGEALAEAVADTKATDTNTLSSDEEDDVIIERKQYYVPPVATKKQKQVQKPIISPAYTNSTSRQQSLTKFLCESDLLNGDDTQEGVKDADDILKGPDATSQGVAPTDPHALERSPYEDSDEDPHMDLEEDADPELPWTCKHCNFLNEVSPDLCVMCDADRSEDAGAEGKGGTGKKASSINVNGTLLGIGSKKMSYAQKKELVGHRKPTDPFTVARKKRVAAQGTLNTYAPGGATFSAGGLAGLKKTPEKIHDLRAKLSEIKNGSPASQRSSRPVLSRPQSANSDNMFAKRGSRRPTSASSSKESTGYTDPKPFSKMLR